MERFINFVNSTNFEDIKPTPDKVNSAGAFNNIFSSEKTPDQFTKGIFGIKKFSDKSNSINF